MSQTADCDICITNIRNAILTHTHAPSITDKPASNWIKSSHDFSIPTHSHEVIIPGPNDPSDLKVNIQPQKDGVVKTETRTEKRRQKDQRFEIMRGAVPFGDLVPCTGALTGRKTWLRLCSWRQPSHQERSTTHRTPDFRKLVPRSK